MTEIESLFATGGVIRRDAAPWVGEGMTHAGPITREMLDAFIAKVEAGPTVEQRQRALDENVAIVRLMGRLKERSGD